MAWSGLVTYPCQALSYIHHEVAQILERTYFRKELDGLFWFSKWIKAFIKTGKYIHIFKVFINTNALCQSNC